MKGFNIRVYSIFVLLFVLTLTPVLALSASIGNARMILYPTIVPGETSTIEKTILVRNINNVSVMIHLESLGDIENMTELLDNDFVLEPLQEKDARFRLTIDEPGRYEGNIAVSFALAEDAQSSGVGLLSNIIVIAREGNETTHVEVNQTIPTNQTQPDDENDSRPNPLVGLGIIVVIVAIGIIGFKFLKRGKDVAKKPRKRKTKRKR